MKKDINWKTITTKDLAALIYQHLKNDGIDAVLVVGSCVTIYSKEDCVKDRLASFFYWSNRQGLEQAIMVGLDNKINIKKIREWAMAERQEKKFLQFEEELKKTKSQTKYKH